MNRTALGTREVIVIVVEVHILLVAVKAAIIFVQS
jgi:hypothetical protein